MIGQLILSSDWLSQDVTGNKMDSNNLATLFAPNILHSMKAGPGDGTMSPDNNFKAAERTETINIVRTLIDFNKELFELCWEDLHSLYVRYCVLCTVLYCTVLTSTLFTSGCTRTCPRPWTTSSAAERCSTETSMSSVFVFKYFSPIQIFLPFIDLRFLEEFESSVIYDMPEPRLIGPNVEPPAFDHSQER